MQEQQVEEFALMMRREWEQLVEQEGGVRAQPTQLDPDAEPPCPACGTVAPLVAGACSDCGLHLG